ncbi:MAG: NAD(P)-dependent oxidoreductase, partial [Flavisolibacter sp.]
MNQKAFLGMGLLGSAFTRAMVNRGEAVKIWNRTAEKAEKLKSTGIEVCSSPAETVKGVNRIHLALKDDASVDEVLEAAAPALEPDAIIVDHTTTTKEGAVERTRYWKEKGFTYQHVPVFMGPANALEASGIMLISGDPAIAALLEPELCLMTGKLMKLGEETGKAAAIKLAGNSFLVCFTFGLRETLTVSKSLGLSVDDLQQLFACWNPAGQIEARLTRMTSADLSQPSWELAMARKDTGLFLQSTEKAGLYPELLP